MSRPTLRERNLARAVQARLTKAKADARRKKIARAAAVALPRGGREDRFVQILRRKHGSSSLSAQKEHLTRERWGEKRKNAIEHFASEPGPLRGLTTFVDYKTGAAGWFLVHRSTETPSRWQATFFDGGTDEPWGDSRHEDFKKLLEHVKHDVRWETVERVAKRGR